MSFLTVQLVTVPVGARVSADGHVCMFSFSNEVEYRVAEIKVCTHLSANAFICHTQGIACRAFECCRSQGNLYSITSLRERRMPACVCHEYPCVHAAFRALLGTRRSRDRCADDRNWCRCAWRKSRGRESCSSSLPIGLVLAIQGAALARDDASCLRRCTRLARDAVLAENERCYAELQLRTRFRHMDLPLVDAAGWLVVEYDL